MLRERDIGREDEAELAAEARMITRLLGGTDRALAAFPQRLDLLDPYSARIYESTWERLKKDFPVTTKRRPWVLRLLTEAMKELTLRQMAAEQRQWRPLFT